MLRLFLLLPALTLFMVSASSALAVDNSGLIFLHHRMIDPSTGRFISADPASLSGNIQSNKYAYGNNDPSTSADPSGMAAPKTPLHPPPNFAGSGPNKFIPRYIGDDPNPSTSARIDMSRFATSTYSIDYNSWVAEHDDPAIGPEWTARIDTAEQKAAEIDRRLVAYDWLLQAQHWQALNPGSEIPYSTNYEEAKSLTQDLLQQMMDYDEYTYEMIQDSRHDDSPGSLAFQKITGHQFIPFALNQGNGLAWGCDRDEGFVNCDSYFSFWLTGRHFLVRGLAKGIPDSEWYGRHPEASSPVMPGQPKPTPTPAATNTPTPTAGPIVRTQPDSYPGDVGSHLPGAPR